MLTVWMLILIKNKVMKVKDVIEELKKFDPEAKVVVLGQDNGIEDALIEVLIVRRERYRNENVVSIL